MSSYNSQVRSPSSNIFQPFICRPFAFPITHFLLCFFSTFYVCIITNLCTLYIDNQWSDPLHPYFCLLPSPQTLSYSAALKMFLATYCFSPCFILFVLLHHSLVIKRSPDVIDSFCHMPFDLPHLIIARPASADLDRKDVFFFFYIFFHLVFLLSVQCAIVHVFLRIENYSNSWSVQITISGFYSPHV